LALRAADGWTTPDQTGLRRGYFTSAKGSVQETVAAVDPALALGAVGPEGAETKEDCQLELARKGTGSTLTFAWASQIHTSVRT
jgi:hypothetical protein